MSVEVRASNLHKSYRDGARQVEVLAGVDLTVAAGELVAVVGPSGSGKSTLLHLLGALDEPDRGQVLIGGKDLATIGRQKLARFRNQTLGFVFQSHQLLPDFTALENVMIPGRIAGRDPHTIAERALELLTEVRLSERLDHFPSELSGGERQRVALCRALLMEPPLVLADEPTGNLDPASAEQVFQRMLDLQALHGTTLVLVTHNPVIAERCGRLLKLERGVLHELERGSAPRAQPSL